MGITGKKANNANRVTFSNKKNARLQHVNLQTKRFFSPELNRNVKLKVATSTMRTITKLGLDETAKKLASTFPSFERCLHPCYSLMRSRVPLSLPPPSLPSLPSLIP